MKKNGQLAGVFLLCAIPMFAPAASATEAVLYDSRRNMPAVTISLPAGWDGTYEIHYPASGVGDYSYVLQNSATGQWMQKFPMQSFFHCEMEGWIPPEVTAMLASAGLTKPLTAFEVLQVFINYRQQQQIEVVASAKNEQAIADFKTQFQQLGGAQDMDYGFGRFSFGVDVDAATALLEYEQEGTLYREHVSVSVLYAQTFAELRTVGNRVRSTDWKVFLGVTGGPADRFDNPDDETAKSIWASTKNTPQWDQALAREANEKAAREMKRQQDQNAMWQNVIETQRRIGESRQQVFNNRFEAQSRAFNNMTDVIAGVERVESPYGGELKIDYSKNHAWVDANGDLVYSDSGLFDPNRLPNSSGSYLQIR